ncbi:MAG TPA: TMEM175 family protein [Chitinophagaceae bacterium]|jgi:uncharacterized membrane protein|nr:TMEM175 family protein [Chitinophagaceae bacterium]HMU59429.1 TMEM175 family protein [Chitinophagaceae bacterium]
MLRKKLFRLHNTKEIDKKHEIFRVEALSDAVFAFSVSLLIISLEVPNTFEELKATIHNFVPFFATVALVFFFWYLQNEYFRNYGLNDGKVVFLNLALLALILFYAFPLKFLFTLLLSWFTGISFFSEVPKEGESILTQEQFPELIVFFSIGYAIIWFIFYLLYHHTFKKRKVLELTAVETAYLSNQRLDALVQVAIGLLSMVFSLLRLPLISGLCFLLLPVWLLVNNHHFKKQLKAVSGR